MALTLINKLYGIERDMEEAGDAQRYQTRQSQSQAFLEQLKARLDKTPPQVTSSKCLGQAINCLASNWLKLIRYIERGTPAHRQQPCRAGECYQRCKTDPPQRLKIDPGVNLLL